MSDYAAWLEENDRYLSGALKDLRKRLERMGTGDVQSRPAVPTASRPRASLWSRWFRRRRRPTVEPAEASAPAQAPEAARPEIPAEAPEFKPALQLLAERLELSRFETEVLLLCSATELDTRVASLCARAQGDPHKPHPTFSLALRLFDAPAWDVLSPERPLRFWRLIEISQSGAQPLVEAPLRADERIVSFIKGMNYLDDRLSPLLASLPAAPDPLPASQQEVVDALVRQLRPSVPSPRLPVLQLLGTDEFSKQAVAQAVGAALGVQVLRLSSDLLPAGVSEQETMARLWQRETRLLALALYIDANDTDRGNAQTVQIRQLISRIGGLVFVDAREPWVGSGMNAISVDVAKPTADEQRTAWLSELNGRAESHAQALAGNFDFSLRKIHQVAGAALAATEAGADDLGALLWRGALMHARPALDQLAQRIEPKAGWDDIQLPAEEKALLRQIADQVALRTTVYDDWGFRSRMNRGLGISALFAGESGTGKTMAAEVLAGELELLLYRIDLSAVVSKYIGETEKNLRRLFDAAEEGGAILLFDEADALFGRRSEVKDSHDRYANIEVNYLLQRMESYRGLAILATNLKSALDSAFLRRLRFIVNFPFPGPRERRAIWAGVFPTQARLGSLDLDRLAKLSLSGGSIQSIAMHAAFLAAHAGTPIGMRCVLEAVRAELRKLERPVNETELRPLEYAGDRT